MASVLVLANDPIGRRMAGTGIRYWNLARVLAREHAVTLAAPSIDDLAPVPGATIQSFEVTRSSDESLGKWQARLIADHDIVVAADIPYYDCDAETLRTRHLAIDLYAPAILEKLEFARVDPERGDEERSDDVRSLNRLLSLGDFFFCATERQRDFWLGGLASAGRLAIEHVRADAELRTLIDTVPFGMPQEPPTKTGDGPRSTIAGITDDDFVILWNGGLWNWLDPLTAIRAVAELRGEVPRVSLVFMGTKSPLHRSQTMTKLDDAINLSRDLGLLGQNVFFNEWVDYEQRQNWLLEADVAISLHQPTAEARFAFRTRMLDLFWCGVPVIATQGDVLADTVSEGRIGIVVPPGDVGAVREAMLLMSDRTKLASMNAGFGQLREEYTWERVAKPLLDFCRNPNRVTAKHVASPQDEYIHHLERQYSETADYTRHLERVLADQTAAIERSLTGRVSSLARRYFGGTD